MTDKPTRRRWPWGAAVLVSIMVVAYPLSYGPFMLLLYAARNNERMYDWLTEIYVIYHPLGWLRDASPRFDELTRWYVEWWLG